MNGMIKLRGLKEGDLILIGQWPPYPAIFSELDYTLREKGWLQEYFKRENTFCFIAEEKGMPVGFSILSKTGEGEAEFRIALRGDRTGKGLGGLIASMTLEKGFKELGFSKIHLIVRKTNAIAIKLYQKLGFIRSGECCKNIQGKQVEFVEMEIIKHSERY